MANLFVSIEAKGLDALNAKLGDTQRKFESAQKDAESFAKGLETRVAGAAKAASTAAGVHIKNTASDIYELEGSTYGAKPAEGMSKGQAAFGAPAPAPGASPTGDDDPGKKSKSTLDFLSTKRREITRTMRGVNQLGGEIKGGLLLSTELLRRSMAGGLEPVLQRLQLRQVALIAKTEGWGNAQKRAVATGLTWVNNISKIEENLKRVSDAMKPLGDMATKVFAAGTAAILGMSAAASPQAFNTLTGSFRLLSMEIGNSFTPYILRASLAIQQAARWVRGLNKETTDSIVKWFVWGTAIAGVVMILPKLVAGLAAVVSVGKTLATLFTLLAANPLVLAISLISAALFGMAIAAKTAVDAISELANQGSKEVLGGVTRKEFEEDPLFQRVQAMRKAGKDQKEILEEINKETNQRFEQMRRSEAKVEQFSTLEKLFNGDDFQVANDRLKKSTKSFEVSRAIREETRGTKFQGAKSGNELALAGPQGGQANTGFESFANTYKRIQQTLIGEGDLDREMKRRAMDFYLMMQAEVPKINGNLNSVEAKLGAGK